MRKIAYTIVVLFIFVLTIGGCANTVPPPSRTGTKGSFSALFAKRYTFETAFADSDMVALVRVGNWLSEDNELSITYYEAEIINIYKGESVKNIVLVQDGCSEWTMRGFTLFIAGNELLLFLQKGESDEYAELYWIAGSFTTVLYTSKSNSGEVFYMDRYGLLGETIDIDTNYSSQRALFKELCDNANAKDPLFCSKDQRIYGFPYVFSKADLDALIYSL